MNEDVQRLKQKNGNILMLFLQITVLPLPSPRAFSPVLVTVFENKNGRSKKKENKEGLIGQLYSL